MALLLASRESAFERVLGRTIRTAESMDCPRVHAVECAATRGSTLVYQLRRVLDVLGMGSFPPGHAPIRGCLATATPRSHTDEAAVSRSSCHTRFSSDPSAYQGATRASEAGLGETASLAQSDDFA